LPCELNSSPPGEIEARRSKRGMWGVRSSCSCRRWTIGRDGHCRQESSEPCRKWCTVARAWALSSRRPWRPGGSVRPGRAEEEGTSRVVRSWMDDRYYNKNNYLFHLNPRRRSADGRLPFNDVWWTRGPATVDSVHHTMDLFHRFFNRKIIH
jgi:hypothetical protein